MAPAVYLSDFKVNSFFLKKTYYIILSYTFNLILLRTFFSCSLARVMSEDTDPREQTSHGSIGESFCQDLLLLKGSSALRPFARFPTL